MTKLELEKLNPKSKYWRDKADILWRKIVLAPGRCTKCFSSKNLDPHHLINKRRRQDLRHDPKCGLCLCRNCHTFKDDSPHIGSVKFDDWLKENKPKVWAWKKSQNSIPMPVDYMAAYEKLKEISNEK